MRLLTELRPRDSPPVYDGLTAHIQVDSQLTLVTTIGAAEDLVAALRTNLYVKNMATRPDTNVMIPVAS